MHCGDLVVGQGLRTGQVGIPCPHAPVPSLPCPIAFHLDMPHPHAHHTPNHPPLPPTTTHIDSHSSGPAFQDKTEDILFVHILQHYCLTYLDLIDLEMAFLVTCVVGMEQDGMAPDCREDGLWRYLHSAI